MAPPNPTALTNATRFRPNHFRTHSRSPSRSPVRKAKFTAQHLDPLLNNLSPDSTLKALRATDTIPASESAGDVLAKSIADATPEEREIGIRAAFAAQKLKEWRLEISKWLWPGRRDQGLGVGFLPSADAAVQEDGEQHIYIGYLPLRVLNQYGQRIEDIKDALESLEMEDLKDHVLTAHASSKPPSAIVKSASAARGSYGRMRDFTALITATVIQALPDLATVNMLIDTWDVRIAVLRELPMVLDLMELTNEGLRKASRSYRDPTQAPHLTLADYHQIREGLGDKVKDLGRRVDKILDMLDGHDDALPQSWIDFLENLELEFATWCAKAEQLAHDNDARQNNEARRATATPTPADFPQPNLEQTRNGGEKPPLSLNIPASGHRREKSEVSIADSVLSTDSAGEIVDVRKSQVLLSPKVSVIEGSGGGAVPRPPTVQRASTASIEVIPKEQLKKLDVRRSMSADLLTKLSSQSGDTTPTRSYKALTGESPTRETPVAELEDPHSTPKVHSNATAVLGQPSPSLMVEPLRVQERQAPSEQLQTPALPRRSSKRNSLSLSTTLSGQAASSNDLVSPVSPEQATPQSSLVSPISPRKVSDESDSLDSKIKDILQNLPTKIRLANRDGSLPNKSSLSATSSRAATPTPALIPEPSKHSRRSSTAEAGIRVYHLHQNSQTRDTKPIKLFVRAVGENGERVMVRVGGGWADLAEYLREYSAHHGRRSTSEGLMEVAQYPGKTGREKKASSQVLSPTPLPGGMTMPKRTRPRSMSGSSSGSRSRSPSPPPATDPNLTPPVPPIPASYTMHTPTMSVTSHPNGHTDVDFRDPDPTSEMSARGGEAVEPEAGPYKRTSSMHVPGVTTTTTVQSPAALNPVKYVPLGGAGPKNNNRRSTTYGAVPREQNDAWVEGMVGKARAVSGGSQTVHGPTTTTTTTVVSSVPASRRASEAVTAPTATPPKDGKAPTSPADRPGVVRRKSRLGLGDVSGIKRVFLRRKSSKSSNK
ncbi:uncharacterized protein HMPREF1541_04951 [Cyphellophora europaea CBS 101466]|uniref:GAR domain-containing protein n=1 Tax=Cyphellophora europaea (strain CBS 101466) TaxID=1220924 RepID=W2RW44_CYPE1|nr:uncharacterized protein HMPREF1541_04951 [Cyphellophora europaea CBS 101466]ETN40672.1 hypothetical protein HMPREF1541_04951 [Cyphellophora europaea CBS 101466]